MNSTTTTAIICLTIITLVSLIYAIIRTLNQERTSREQLYLARDRNAFIHLAANYLRGPITLLVGAAEALGETLEASLAGNLQAIVASLQGKVETIMKQVETNPVVGDARHELVKVAATELESDLAKLEKLLPMLPAENEQVGLLREGARRLRQMVTTFQLLTKVENITTLPASKPLEVVGLSGLLTRALHQSSEVISNKHLQIVTPTQSELYFPGTPELLEYVVSSLLANAAAFSPNGGTITINATSTARGLSLSIEDQGQGIEPQQLAHLFNPFMKDGGKDGLKLNHDGLGLSLYLDRIIMEGFGGAIAAESVVEHGTTITLSWPPNSTEAK
jgi:signal transduction histidine kinase